MTSIAGAGGGTVLLAAMLQFMNPAEAIPVHGVIQFTSNITRTWLLRKFVNWNIIFKFSLLLPTGIFIGLKIFQNIDGDNIKNLQIFVSGNHIGKDIRIVPDRNLSANELVKITKELKNFGAKRVFIVTENLVQ